MKCRYVGSKYMHFLTANTRRHQPRGDAVSNLCLGQPEHGRDSGAFGQFARALHQRGG
jgi:hypothetical protein